MLKNTAKLRLTNTDIINLVPATDV